MRLKLIGVMMFAAILGMALGSCGLNCTPMPGEDVKVLVDNERITQNPIQFRGSLHVQTCAWFKGGIVKSWWDPWDEATDSCLRSRAKAGDSIIKVLEKRF